jgi:hypothetical protein
LFPQLFYKFIWGALFIVSNFGLSILTSFCSKLFHNIYIFSFTTYIKKEQLFRFETPQIFSWINRNKNSRRTERYKHGVKFTITFVENSSHIVAIPNFVLPVSDMELNFRRNSLGITLKFETFLSCYEINNLFKLRIFKNFVPRTFEISKIWLFSNVTEL